MWSNSDQITFGEKRWVLLDILLALDYAEQWVNFIFTTFKWSSFRGCKQKILGKVNFLVNLLTY